MEHRSRVGKGSRLTQSPPSSYRIVWIVHRCVRAADNLLFSNRSTSAILDVSPGRCAPAVHTHVDRTVRMKAGFYTAQWSCNCLAPHWDPRRHMDNNTRQQVHTGEQWGQERTQPAAENCSPNANAELRCTTAKQWTVGPSAEEPPTSANIRK